MNKKRMWKNDLPLIVIRVIKEI